MIRLIANKTYDIEYILWVFAKIMILPVIMYMWGLCYCIVPFCNQWGRPAPDLSLFWGDPATFLSFLGSVSEYLHLKKKLQDRGSEPVNFVIFALFGSLS